MTGQADSTIIIGVLALQGAFVEHITLLRQAARSLQQSYSQTHQPSSLESPPSPTSTQPEVKNDKSPIFSHNGADNSPRNISTETPNRATSHTTADNAALPTFHIIQVRTADQLATCDALILPGGESTSISLIAERCNLLEPLRQFVKVQRKPVWGTCAGLILLAESANKTKETGQELIGGLDVRVHRNYFGRQVESFEADLELPFLRKGESFHTVFIRAPVVEKVLTPEEVDQSEKNAASDGTATVLAPPRQATNAAVEILGRLPGRAKTIRDQTTTAEELGEDGDIVAVKQGNVFGTAFHPELTGDERIHAWWLGEVVRLKAERKV